MTTTATADYTLELEVYAEVTPAVSAVTNAPPEKCRPEEPATVEISEVWILNAQGLPSQQLVEVSPALLEVLTDALLEQAAEDERWAEFEAETAEEDAHNTAIWGVIRDAVEKYGQPKKPSGSND